MSAKEVRFSTDARDRMLKGINTLCLGPLKLCHNLIKMEERNYGLEALFGRRYFEAVT